MATLDLDKWGMGAWLDPGLAGEEAADSIQRLLAALIAYRLQLSRERHTCERAQRRELERELDDAYKTGTMVMALLRTERELLR